MPLDTEVEICNAALYRAGVTKRIESLTDQNPEADACELEYAATLDMVLEDHPWQFSMKYATLTKQAATPEWYWSYQYQLPDDFLTMQNLEAENFTYEIASGRLLLTNEDSPLKIRYASRVDDPTEMPMAFKQALLTKLAAVLCIGLTKDLNRSELLEQRYEKLISDARFYDQSRRSYQPLDSSVFLDSRTVGPEVVDTEGDLN